MDLQFLAHPSFVLFAGAHAALAALLILASELLHRRALRRGGDPARTRRSGRICRVTVAALLAVGIGAFAAPAYHPFLGERYLREALDALEKDDSDAAQASFRAAAHHLGRVEQILAKGGAWASLVERFVRPWGGTEAVQSALGTAHFLLGNCRRAAPYVEAELSRRPGAARTALLSYRLAVCHASGDRGDAAEEALLRALLIDRRYASQARKDSRLKTLAEELLWRRL